MLSFFDFKTYFRIFRKSFSAADTDVIPLTPNRVVFLVCFFLIFSLIQIFNAICFKLDELLYNEFRDVKPKQPVFIIGNPRSGTTYIHRLLAMDTDRFFCFKTWEIIFPSIIQKKILLLFGRLDCWLGQPIFKAIQKKEKAALSRFNQMHPTGLFYPEECSLLFIHIFSAHNLLFLFPIKGEFAWFQDFDQSLSISEKNRIMSFYIECIKRQAFYLGHKGDLLSKSPTFSSKIKSLYEYFPECKIIYMIRSPLEVVPSVFSFVDGIARSTTEFTINQEMYDNIYQMTKIFYEYPLSCMEEEDPTRYAIVRYEELVSKPREVITSIYSRFGFDMKAEHLRLLEQADDQAKKYRSHHRYSLDQFNLSEKTIQHDFKKVFDRFDFR